MKNHLQNPHMIRRVRALGVLDGDPLTLVDVGMRSGVQGYWPVFGTNLRVIGFEPDETEFNALSAQKQPYEQIVLRDALDSEPRQRNFYIRPHNRAADGFHVGLNWWCGRLGHTVKDALPHDYASYLPNRDAREGPERTTKIQTTTFNKIARERGIDTVDFMKVDAEGAELDVIKGASEHIGGNGILGIEIEVRTLPLLDAPLFDEICRHLYGCGYYLADVDFHRCSRAVLPLPVAANHRNHKLEPLAAGHTIGGQIALGDALFMRDLPSEGFWPDRGNERQLRKIIKATCLYELFAMPDCAAALLKYYREPLHDLVDVDYLLTFLRTGGRAARVFSRLYQRSRFTSSGWWRLLAQSTKREFAGSHRRISKI